MINLLIPVIARHSHNCRHTQPDPNSGKVVFCFFVLITITIALWAAIVFTIKYRKYKSLKGAWYGGERGEDGFVYSIALDVLCCVCIAWLILILMLISEQIIS